MRMMRIFMLFTFLGIGTCFANNSYSQETFFTVELNNRTIKEVFSEIEESSEYIFFYLDHSLDLNRKVSVKVKDQQVSAILDQVFKGTENQYYISDRQIIISKENGHVAPPSAQQQRELKTITGTVSDDLGPVAGANIKVKGTTLGIISDMDGKFVLEKVPENATIQVSYIGYVTQEIVITNQTHLNILLKEDAVGIEEIVVIGYGTQTKSRMISSVSTIKADEVNGRPVTMLTQAIAGQAAGVTSIQRSGQPGNSGTEIQIRGIGSFGASSDPLILIDGIPGTMNTVDPNDVESITFLKDAASAAIYGARAANGVILITTKIGKTESKLKVSYNGYVGIQTPTSLPEMVSGWEYMELFNEAEPGKYSAEAIQKSKDGSDPDNYGNVDYIGQAFKNSVQSGHNLSLVGGSAITQYSVSFGYLYQNGIIDNNDYNRYNTRINITNAISRTLKFTTRAYGRMSQENQPAPPASMDYTDMLNLIGNVVRTPSIYPDKLSNGDWGGGVVGKGTPTSMAAAESFYKARGSEFGINLRLDWQVIEGLKLSAIGGYTQNDDATKRFLATQRINDKLTLSPSSLEQKTKFTDYKTLQFLAEYNKVFGRNEINVLVGHSFETSYYEDVTASRQNFPSNDYPYLGLGDDATQTNAGGASEWALDSYFGRLQYNFDMKYLAEFSMRYDGSSRFPKDKKYAFFPSVGIGWRISEEAFIKDNLTWLNELKIKGTYGVLGNQNTKKSDGTQNYYPYQTVYSSGYNYPFGDAINKGLASTTYVDPAIHWESTETKDIGLEMSVLKNTLSFSATYFDKYTYNILVSPGSSVSTVIGKTLGDQNSGKLSNKGLELTLSYKNKIGDFKYGATGNFTYVKNEVLDLGTGNNVLQLNGLTGNGVDRFVDYPVNIYYGYKTDGLYIDQNDIDEWQKTNDQKNVNPTPKPGDIRYKDISGDGVVGPEDLVVLGSRVPKYSYGLNLTGEYKNFDLSILLQGVSGVSGYLDTYAGFAFNQAGQIQTWQRDERWRADAPSRTAKYPRLENLPSSGSNNTRMSDFWVLNASYLRIKNIQLGYTVPKSITDKLMLEALRFNLSGENLATFSHYRKGWDPEKNGGSDYYPILANFTFGVNVIF